MRSYKFSLLSTTVIPAFVGAGIVVGGALSQAAPVHAANIGMEQPTLLPVAKPKPQLIQLAQCKPCNPCAAKKGCNPCAAKKGCNPCNPCAAKKGCNPCNPCGAKRACNPCNPCNPCAGGGAVSKKCVVPRLQAAWAKSPCNPCNPCAPKRGCNPCNPCAAKKQGCNPCNPCAAKKRGCNPCNPCAAKKGCNPCNPCNPCGAGGGSEISSAEAASVYNCLMPEMKKAYRKAGLRNVKGYTGWLKINKVAYQSATHGGRYVNNYANAKADHHYNKFEKAGILPKGSVLAKDSFAVQPNGKIGLGPLFIMEKMSKGFNKGSGDWRYSMVMPNGKVAGTTKGKGMSMKFCAECHAAVAPEQDHVLFVPDEYRVKF